MSKLLPWEDPATKDHYDPVYVKILLEKIQPKQKELSSNLVGLSPLEAKRQGLRDTIRIHEELNLVIPYDSFKDEIEVTDSTIPSVDAYPIPIRVYKLKSLRSESNAVYINFHGGGYSLGGLGQEQSLLYHLAKYAGVVVIDVDYRLVPEWNYSTLFYDSYAAIKYVKENPKNFAVDPSKVAIGGTSAGAKIVLSAAHVFRDLNASVQLVSANVPPAGSTEEERAFESFKKFDNAFGLNSERTEFFGKLIEGSQKDGKRVQDSDVTKFFGLDANQVKRYEKSNLGLTNFKGLPKHIVTVGDHDVLKDSGKKYAKLLVENEIDVVFGVAKGLGHGHSLYSNLTNQGRKYWDTLTEELKRL